MKCGFRQKTEGIKGREGRRRKKKNVFLWLARFSEAYDVMKLDTKQETVVSMLLILIQIDANRNCVTVSGLASNFISS